MTTDVLDHRSGRLNHEVATAADPAVSHVLPPSGQGYYVKSPDRVWARPETIRAFQAIAQEWHRRHPQGPRLGVTDISLRGGGPMSPHSSHQHGGDVDIRPMRNDGKEDSVEYTMPTYDRALTQDLVDVVRGNQVLAIKQIFFNDPQVRGVKPLTGHSNHLHVTFGSGPPAGGAPAPATPPASYIPPGPSAPPAPSTPRPSGLGASPGSAPGVPRVPLGRIEAILPGGKRYRYTFTSDDLLWTARFLMGEAGGRNDADNRAVISTMINLYGLIRHRQYPTFSDFLRAYSTPLQLWLKSPGAARRHQQNPDFVRAGRTYPPPAPPGIQVGQLGRFHRLQKTPWSSLPAPARDLALQALTGRVANPIGNATQFSNTAVYYRDRHGVAPQPQQWQQFTRRYAAGMRWTWIGPRAGLRQQASNAFFVENRFAQLPVPAVRVVR